MNVCFAALYYEPSLAPLSPAQYLDRLPIERYLPQALAALGWEVNVVFHFPIEAQWSEGHVHYHFVPSRGAAALALPAIRRIRDLQPDIVHFHGLLLTANLFLLWRTLGKTAPPVVAHYHGGYPSPHPLRRRLQRANLRRLSRALFTTREHAESFVTAGVLRPNQIAELMEVSTAFQMKPRAEARAATGMVGEPVFLWAGRLHPIKDPLTALDGFTRIQAAWPEAHLYCHYLTGELLPEMKAFLEHRPQLKTHVHFRGRLPHPQMEAVFNSADFFLQASRREFSGYAVLEAMACGAIPVVSDIPSFRRMTDGGGYGLLFPPGEAQSLAERVLAVDLATIPERAAAVRAHFVKEFSFEAMAAKLSAVYEEALQERQGRRG
jgi:glycosyltransferase involved in cell wall biosynthesis